MSLPEFSPTLLAALSNPERRPLCRVTLCDTAWRVQEQITGIVTPDSGFNMDDNGARSCNLTIVNNDGSRTPEPGSSVWYGRFGVEWGLLTSEGAEYVDLGRFVSTRGSARAQASAGWTSLQLEPPSALWGSFNAYWQISANDRIVDVLTAIAIDAGEDPARLVLYPTDEIVGADITFAPGDSRWDAACRIAAAAQDVGLVLKLIYDGRGAPRLRPEVDPATTAPSWTFRRGDGILIDIDRSWDDRDFANRVIVYGGSGSSATIVSEVADTGTGPYSISQRGEWVCKWPNGQEFDPLINTQARADARRDYLWRERRTSQENVRTSGLIIPGLEWGDVVEVEEARVTRAKGNYVLRGGYSFGLGPGGTMSLTGRRVVRP